MTFLEPALLAALPLAALPVVIHLIHLYRRKQVLWAAMMFLLAAQQMHKGFSKLKQILILSLRVLAVAGILFAITRPLSGGWLGLTGGAPDTVLILLDRSASMEQHPVSSKLTKREAGLQNVSKAIKDALGNRSKLVLIDSASGKPLPLSDSDRLVDLPQTGPSDTASDIPNLLQNALDYITSNKTGRTDVWLISDLQKSDWNSSSGRWEPLRSAFAALKAVRFHLLTYTEKPEDDFGIRIDHVTRRQSGEKAELLLDLKIDRNNPNSGPIEIPIRFVINGVSTTSKVTLKDSQLFIQGFSLPIDKSLVRGFGRAELPTDVFPANNTFFFVFDEPPVLRSLVVTDGDADLSPILAALTASPDPSRNCTTSQLDIQRAPEIPWDEIGFLLWQAPIPRDDTPLYRQLIDHVASGRTLLFLPPSVPTSAEIYGIHWDQWIPSESPQNPEWWRNDSDLLANTLDGSSLPVGTLEVSRTCQIVGPGVPLARLAGRGPLLLRPTTEHGVYFLGTFPGPGFSSLGRDGVILFAMLHRALNAGSESLGKTQQRPASVSALSGSLEKWQLASESNGDPVSSSNLPINSGVVTNGSELVALNRPFSEDQLDALSPETLRALFAGLDFRILSDTLEDGRSLTNEVWRTFLFLMALALIGETLLCLPPSTTPDSKTQPRDGRKTFA